jgi:hypothetical protein
MKKFAVLFMAFVFIYACECHCFRFEHPLTDVTQKQIFVLKKPKPRKEIRKLQVRVRGEIDGTAKLMLLLKRDVYDSIELEGTFDLEMTNEWKLDTARFIYDPVNVTNGTVSLIYEFLE